MRLGPKTAYRVEVAGLLLVLVSLGWHELIEEPVSDIHANAKHYEVNERFELVWRYLHGLRGEIVEKKVPSSQSALDYNYLKDRWSRLAIEKDNVARQSEVFRGIRIVLFLVGSVLLTVGRYYELHLRLEKEGPS